MSIPLQVNGPFSTNFPDEAAAGRDLILIGTGTGISPLLGLLHARQRSPMLLSTGYTEKTYLVMVCRSLHDLVMLESIPRRIRGLSIVVFHTKDEDDGNVDMHALASEALDRRHDITSASTSSQHSKVFASEGAHGHVLIFEAIVLLAALVGIWFGAAIAQGLISDWGRNPVVDEATPTIWHQDWLQGITMIVFVNAFSFAFAFGAGPGAARLSHSGRIDHATGVRTCDSTSEDLLHSLVERDTARLLPGDIAPDGTEDSINFEGLSSEMSADSTEVMAADEDFRVELSFRRGRPDILSLLAECSEAFDDFGRRQRPLEGGIPFPMHVCASGHPSLIADTKAACECISKELYRENRQRVIFSEVSFDMSAI